MARSNDPVRIFGDRVRQRRCQLGLSQEQLAEKSGFHRTYIGTVERGERNPALRNVVRLAEALSMDAGTLTHGLRS